VCAAGPKPASVVKASQAVSEHPKAHAPAAIKAKPAVVSAPATPPAPVAQPEPTPIAPVAPTVEKPVIKGTVIINENTTVRELAEKMNEKPATCLENCLLWAALPQ